MSEETPYEELPITLTPRVTGYSITYNGRLQLQHETPHPLTIEIPAPPSTGTYRYTITIETDNDQPRRQPLSITEPLDITWLQDVLDDAQ